MKKIKIKTRPESPVNFDFSQEMASLIARAYALFDFPVKGRLSVCTPCCVSEEEMQELIKTPVKNLSLPAIYNYLDAVHYDEEGSEIKHFLPRILELLAMGKDISHSTELSLQKCHFEKPCWNDKERHFMHEFSANFWTNYLKINPKLFESAMDFVLMFHLAGLSTEHLLKIWEAMIFTQETALAHFQRFMRYDFSEGFYQNSFSDNPDFNKQISLWVKNPVFIDKILQCIINQIFNNEIETEKLNDFEILYAQLEDLKRKSF